MLHSDPANTAGTAKIPLTRLVQRTLKGQRSQIEPALSKIDISKLFWEQLQNGSADFSSALGRGKIFPS